MFKRESLQARKENELRSKTNNISAQFNSLMQTHDFLSGRVHKNSQYLKAFGKAVSIMLQESPDDETKAKAQTILDDIAEFRAAMQLEAQQYLDTEDYSLSGKALLDSILLYMIEWTKSKGISLEIDLQTSPDIVTGHISEEQLSTLTADLLENAVASVESNGHLNKKILFVVCEDEAGIIQIVVKDSGVTFDKSVLDSIGKRKITTRKDLGGSGGGYWGISKMMRQSRASLIIEEYKATTGFTKAVIVRFDDKCKYIYRED